MIPTDKNSFYTVHINQKNSIIEHEWEAKLTRIWGFFVFFLEAGAKTKLDVKPKLSDFEFYVLNYIYYILLLYEGRQKYNDQKLFSWVTIDS